MSAGLAASARHSSTAWRATPGARVLGGSRMSISPPLQWPGTLPDAGTLPPPHGGPSCLCTQVELCPPPSSKYLDWGPLQEQTDFLGSRMRSDCPRSEEVCPVRRSALVAMLAALIASSAC